MRQVDDMADDERRTRARGPHERQERGVEAQQRSGRLALNRDYSTGDLREYGTGGGDVGIGGDVTPHGEQHDPEATAEDIERADARFAQYETSDEGGYLEREGSFPPEYPEIEEEDEPSYLDQDVPEREADAHDEELRRLVSDADDKSIEVRDDDELFGT